MITEVVKYLSPLYIGATLIVLAVLQQVILRTWYESKVKKAGGVHAPPLAHEPIIGEVSKTQHLLRSGANEGRINLVVPNCKGSDPESHVAVLREYLRRLWYPSESEFG